MMRNCICIILLLSLVTGCSSRSTSATKPSSSAQKSDDFPLRAAKEELISQGQKLHDRLDYQIIQKDWGWIVTVGNLSGRQPKGQAYFPGDAVMIRIDKDGRVLEYKNVR